MIKNLKAFGYDFETFINVPNGGWWSCTFIEYTNRNNKIVINTPDDNISYFILNISIPNVNGETIVHLLERNELYVSTGSACSSKLKKPEKTILALTKSEELATSSIRISLSHLTTYDEIDELIKVLNKI